MCYYVFLLLHHAVREHFPNQTDFSNRVDKMKSVPAQVIAFDSNKKCIWRDCKVLDYNGDENTYLVCWIDTGQTSWIPRCCIVPLIVYGCYNL